MSYPGYGQPQPYGGGYPPNQPYPQPGGSGFGPHAYGSGPYVQPPNYPPVSQPNYPQGSAYAQSPGYPPQPAYAQAPGYAQQPAYAQTPGYTQQSEFQRIPDSAHEHGLIQESSNDNCKVCQRPISGTTAYICHQCPLVLCYECANNIFYGNKAKQVHPHPLALRVRNAWKCDLCHQHFRGTASFYCRNCDFDACSRCYVGY